MEITGKTNIVGLFGHPVEHTLSPAMHNAAFDYLGLDYCYVPFHVHPDHLMEAVAGIRALSLRGVNVTVPHKERVMAYLDDINEEAAFIGAVNTIRNDDGWLTGYNTDGRGFMRSLQEASIVPRDKKVLIVGAGGAARAIGFHLCKEAAEVFVFDIDSAKAESLVKHLKSVRNNATQARAADMRNRAFAQGMDIIINATPLGLSPGDLLPVKIPLVAKRQAVCDLIYKETPLLRTAAAAGCRTMNGIGMLLWQGVIAFEIWTGICPPDSIMRDALLRRMNQ